MQEVTVAVPNIGLEAYFTFKEPVNTALKAKYNLDPTTSKLRVLSIISMKDMIRNDLRDPYTSLYDTLGLTELQYKQDLNNGIPIVSFSFRDINHVEMFVRTPLNYISSISSISSIEYLNKLIILDLGKLPIPLDTTVFFSDLKDFIESRVGIEPSIVETSVGDVELVTPDEHTLRETIRTNLVTVHKTLSIQLEEITLKHDELLDRLDTIGISLS